MSELAVVPEIGETMNAWEYHDLFLSDGIVFSQFYCPFCEVELVGRSIYKEEKTARSPHFAIFRGKNHLDDCDGRPQNFIQNKNDKKRATFIPRDMHFPEELIQRPKPRSIKKPSVGILGNRPTQEIINKRRSDEIAYHRSVPRTCHLEPIVKQYEKVLKYYNEAHPGEKVDWPAVNAVRKALPLRIQGDLTDYYDGFRTPSLLELHEARIYHGDGYLVRESEQFVISSERKATFQQAELDFQSTISIGCLTADSPRSHHNIFELMENLARNAKRIKWYICGKVLIEDNKATLTVNNLDHIYFKQKL